MRKLLICGLVLTIVAIQSCNKDSNFDQECPYTDQTVTVPAEELAKLETYIDTSNIDATEDARGFFYKIETLGSGTAVGDPCTQVGVKYKGKLTNGNVFDSTTENARVFMLGQLIWGWRKGLPLIKQGGKITLYLPPSLGYGPQPVVDQNTGEVKIPGNSLLIFEIELQEVF
jgi:FKBP-type peptidyl-prolyl cis-trans isomerase FkpA